MTKKERFQYILNWFAQNMPEAESELNYSNPFELLVAVMLSAQCTDRRVNLVTPALFRAYPTPDAMALATKEDILTYIHSVSYPNAKAEHLLLTARRLVDVYGGQVPDNVDDLQTLPGVGRKTANVIASVIFNLPALAVDTHVFRISERLGLTHGSRSPRETEDVLVRYIPQELIPKAHHWLLLHGRYVCTAHKPKCEACGLASWCVSYKRN